jgi:glycogen synthase
VRGNQGFAPQLMIIADDSTNEMAIRQSALVVLKNLVYDQCHKSGVMNGNDYMMIKSNILEALTRQYGNIQLTALLREIIHLIAEMDYPDKWPEILAVVLKNIEGSSDFNCVASSVETLKAITTACGKSI